MDCPGGEVVSGVALLGRRLSCASQASTTQDSAPTAAQFFAGSVSLGGGGRAAFFENTKPDFVYLAAAKVGELAK